MPDYFYNSSGAGNYLEKDNVARAWGGGSDSNDGLSRLTPKLTADNLNSAAGGDNHYFNAGDYNVTTDGGRWIAPANATIDGVQLHQATITFVGTTSAQAVRTNTATADSSLTIGTVKIKSSGAITNLFHLSNSGSFKWTYNLSCMLVLTSNLSYINNAANPNSDLNILDGFGFESDESGGVLNMTNGMLFNMTGGNSNFNLAAMNISGLKGDFGKYLFDVTFVANTTDSTFYSEWYKGVATDIDNQDAAFLMRVVNPPDNSIVKISNSCDLTFDNPSNYTTLCEFASPSANLSQSDYCLMHRQYGKEFKVRTNLLEGTGFTMGHDSDTDTHGINGDVRNIDLTCGCVSSGSFHAFAHFGSTGIRERNTARRVGIMSLGKNGLSYSIGNKGYEIEPNNGEYVFFKGVDAGCMSIGDVCNIRGVFSGQVTKVANSGYANPSAIPTFYGTQVMNDGSAEIDGFMNLDGDVTDTSEGKRTNMFVDNTVNITGTWFRRGVTDYTIATSQSIGTNPFDNILNDDRVKPDGLGIMFLPNEDELIFGFAGKKLI